MTTSQKISIALCTFNGEQFLSNQLQTIRDQKRPADELIACDDGSTDRTVELLEAFAKTTPFPVRILRNPSRLGPAQNFARAMSECTGDLISLCDQDDLWEPSKLAVTGAAFAADPALAFAFSDAQMCGPDGEDLGYRLWTSVGFTGSLRKQFVAGCGFDVLLRQNVVTGATLTFASKYRPLILPIGNGWMHDGWTSLLLSAVGRGMAIDQPLIRYRQHANQSIGAARRSLYQQYLNAKKMDRTVFATQADDYESALARLQEQTEFDLPPGVVAKLQEKIRHCRHRSAIRLGQASKLSAVPELLASRYRRFSLGWKSFSQDLFL
jgi:glycosyltransferase involved in cell wall biosynthesis